MFPTYSVVLLKAKFKTTQHLLTRSENTHSSYDIVSLSHGETYTKFNA